jgi:hypothetical protein
VFAVVVLLGCLCGSFVAYGALDPLPSRNIYPGNEELDEKYDEYTGGRVTLSGTVVATDPLVLEVRDGDGGTTTFTVLADRRPTIGTQLNVLGRARPDGRIRAVQTFTVDSDGFVYTYVSSALAGVWVLVRLLRRWRLRRDLALVRRAEPLGLGDLWVWRDGERQGGDGRA